MGTCGHSLIIRDLYMYNLKYIHQIYMLSIMVILLPIMGVYTGLARLNYQKEEWVVHYSRPLNICVLVILSLYIFIYTYTHVYTTHKSTSTVNQMFQWLQKLVPLKHLSSERMIYAQKS